MEALQNTTIKSIVTRDYRTAAIFEKYSLDFCCKGGVTIKEACSEKHINAELVLAELEQLTKTLPEETLKYSEWPIDKLVDHIVNVHHKYVREMTPVIYAHTQKVAMVHGHNHPEVIEIARHFEAVASDLQQHMMKEEHMLFPYMKAIVEAKRTNGASIASPFGTIQNPIRMMEAEHQAAGDELYKVRTLSSNYVPPEDACTTYRVSFQELQQFERDLHQHVHLENNLLFPKAIALEQELTNS
ncbi:MAG: iron-sulfur cluster repair di-iron protein [Bacteroidetes bacterium]|nr:iron-sulfur cluster repair di-iron protein [Bacteroidota bacterium]MCW5896755.1 iron-sulfur cluster repair di-iron protein [Bacteroidota bacterium]